MNLKDYIATIENYPKEGITFRDISPLMAGWNAENTLSWNQVRKVLLTTKSDMIVDLKLVDLSWLSSCLWVGELVSAPVRKPGKLPSVISMTMKEYGVDTDYARGCHCCGQRVLIRWPWRQVELLRQLSRWLKNLVVLWQVVPLLNWWIERPKKLHYDYKVYNMTKTVSRGCFLSTRHKHYN